jgi:Domain of unknown function (DUF4440)
VDAALRERWAVLREAMELGDVLGLDRLLADECSLTHLTGRVQPKADWLAEVDSGSMEYHRVEDVELAVAAAGPAPVLTVRTMTDATIHGIRATWPLQLRIAHRLQGIDWIVTDMVATTW